VTEKSEEAILERKNRGISGGTCIRKANHCLFMRRRDLSIEV
jgi:hypothetical protein